MGTVRKRNSGVANMRSAMTTFIKNTAAVGKVVPSVTNILAGSLITSPKLPNTDEATRIVYVFTIVNAKPLDTRGVNMRCCQWDGITN
jgi:hypothetical protein